MNTGRRPFSDTLLAAVFALILLVVTAQVVFRYVINSSLTWTEELSRYLFTWLIFLGASAALGERLHITVDLVACRLPSGLRRALGVFNRLAVLLFLELSVVLGFMLVARTAGTRSPALGLPVNLVYYAALPVCFLPALWSEGRSLLLSLRGPGEGGGQ